MYKHEGTAAQRLRELEFEAFILRHKLQQLGAPAATAPLEQTAVSMRGHGAGILGAEAQPSTSVPSPLSAAEVPGHYGAAAHGMRRPAKKRVAFKERDISQLLTTPGSQEADKELLKHAFAQDEHKRETMQRVVIAPSRSCDVVSGPGDAHGLEVHARLLENERIVRTLGKLQSAMPRICPDEEEVLASRRRKVSSGLAALLEACAVQEELMKTSVPSPRRCVTAATFRLGHGQ